jgi:mannose-1-phosphate guanylyltransferase
MKALVLAAGLGTRMKPFTFFRAKASLPLLNIPFIHYPLQYLSVNGIRETVINLHHQPETVRKAVGNQFQGMQIEYSHEKEILGTAGAMRKAAPLLDSDPFIVMNSDMIVDIPLQNVLDFHSSVGADVTLVIMKDARFAHYGGIYFDSEPLRLSGFRSGAGESYHYTGFQLVSPRVLEYIPADRKSGIFTDIYPAHIKELKIFGFVYQGLWKEMGNLKEYLRTNMDLLRNPLPENLRPSGTTPSLVSSAAQIRDGAEVFESIIMDGAEILPDSQIEHSIIGWDVPVSGQVRNQALARGILPWYF